MLRPSVTCGRGMLRDFHCAAFSCAGVRKSMLCAGIALPLENTKESDALWAFPRGVSASAHTAQQRTCAGAHVAHMRTLRSTAHAHMRTMRIVYAEYASAHNTRRRRIIRAHAHYLRICATAHHLRSCTCAHTLRAHLLRPCAAHFVHAAFVDARIVIQGVAEAAAGSGNPPPPKGPRRGGGGW